MPTRKLYKLTTENEHNHGLTELLAAESVERGYITHNDWLSHVNRYAFVWKYLTRNTKKVSRLLDVGCGKLSLPLFLWRNKFKPMEDFQYWGLDLRIKESWIPPESEHWQTHMSFVQCDLSQDRLDAIEEWPGQFDLTVCFEVMEHLPRELGPKLIQRLFNWTKPGGVCFFSTPNAGVSDSVADNHRDPETGESREWDYDAKLEVCEEAGFKVEAEYGTFCGTTRLPESMQEKMETDPVLIKAKEFLSHSAFTTMVAPAFPRESNNALFVLRRPE